MKPRDISNNSKNMFSYKLAHYVFLQISSFPGFVMIGVCFSRQKSICVWQLQCGKSLP